MNLRYLIVALLTVFSAGLAMGQLNVTVVTDKDVYTIGDTIAITMSYVNDADTTTRFVFGTPCVSHFRIGTVWNGDAGITCPDVITTIEVAPHTTQKWYASARALFPSDTYTVTAWLGGASSGSALALGQTSIEVHDYSPLTELTLSVDKHSYVPPDSMRLHVEYFNYTSTAAHLITSSDCLNHLTIDNLVVETAVTGCSADSITVAPLGTFEFDLQLAVPSTKGGHSVTVWLGDADSTQLCYGKASATFAVETVFTYQMQPRWNMFSYPFAEGRALVSELFPDAASKVYAYHSGYVAVDTLKPGEGYWIKYDSPVTANVTGILSEKAVIPLKRGWNLVGTMGVPVQQSQITSIPPTLVPYWYLYNGIGYWNPSTLPAGIGIWVKSMGDGTVTMDASGNH